MKLEIVLSHPGGLWQRALEQEKAPYRILSGPMHAAMLSESPVAVLSRRPDPQTVPLWKKFLAGRGVLVTTGPIARFCGFAPGDSVKIVEDPQPVESAQGRVRTKQFSWGGRESVRETAARYPAGQWRRTFVARLQEAFWLQGLPYARIAYYPDPYRGLFSFRLDFDYHVPADFEEVRLLISAFPGLMTCFLNMKSYEPFPEAVRRLADDGVAIGSHGYIHHVYDRLGQNQWNVRRAGELLQRSGVAAKSFSGPHGLWHPTLQQALEEAGYHYSSEFALDYDDLPFFPAINNRASRVLQIPVHPVCEGVFFEKYGLQTPLLEEYFSTAAAELKKRGDPILFFGHPDGRIGARPGIFRALFEKMSADSDLWKTDMDTWSKWWVERHSWSFEAEGEESLHIKNFSADSGAAAEFVWPDGIERRSARHTLRPVVRRAPSPATSTLADSPLLREKEAPYSPAKKAKALVKRWLDWETKTPVEAYVGADARTHVRKVFRRLKGAPRGDAGWKAPRQAGEKHR